MYEKITERIETETAHIFSNVKNTDKIIKMKRKWMNYINHNNY
jgi:hypothetical protein